MSTRSMRLLGFWVWVCVLVMSVFVENYALAQGQADDGTVTTIEIYRASDNQPINAGTVLGGIAGGVIGHQIGSGRGNTAATIAGTIGGAVIGNEMEKKQRQATRYRITVRLDSGTSLIIEEPRDLNLRVGDRVRIADGHIYRI